MAERKECQKYANCGFRKELAGCPLSCIHYKHKDEVRVVRCKDCKYKFSANGHDKKGCPLDGAGLMNEDDFCSYGERKDNV